MGSIDERFTPKRKRADDDEDGPEAKRIQQELTLIGDKELRRKLCYLNERPSRGGSYEKEVEIMDLTTSDSETDEEEDYNNEDNNNNFIDDVDGEDDEDSSSDDEPDINGFLMEMKMDPTYSPRERALCEWDPDFWH